VAVTNPKGTVAIWNQGETKIPNAADPAKLVGMANEEKSAIFCKLIAKRTIGFGKVWLFKWFSECSYRLLYI